MPKLIAILNVVAWSGFWVFGYLALTHDGQGSLIVAELLAAAGGAVGLWAWLWLARHVEATGYAPPVKRARPAEDAAA